MKFNLIILSLFLVSCQSQVIRPIPAPVPEYTKTWLGEHAFGKLDVHVDWYYYNGDCQQVKCEE